MEGLEGATDRDCLRRVEDGRDGRRLGEGEAQGRREAGQERRRTGEEDLVDLDNVEAGRLDDSLDLGRDLSVDTAGETVEPESVDRRREVEAVLEGVDGAGGSTGRGRQRSLGVLDGEKELGLRSEVGGGGAGGEGVNGEGEGDLGLLGELLGEVGDELEEGK